MAHEKILIVDDEKDVLDSIVEALESDKYEIITTTSGEKALQLLENQPFDLMLLDLNMPGIGGYDVCRRVKKIPHATRIPIMIISSSAQEVDKIAALGLGAVDYITKPFITGELRARIRTQLRLKKNQDDLEQQKNSMEKLVIHDELTGLYNRRYLISRLEEELARAARYRSPLACMIMDIDDFKKINDTYGHAIGDIVLKELANLLKNFARETDVVARYGGEEFVIILPETDVPGAVVFTERLLDTIRSFVFDESNNKLNVTSSVGISGNQEVAVDKDKLLSESDKMLYKAKSEGKNCVRAAP